MRVESRFNYLKWLKEKILHPLHRTKKSKELRPRTHEGISGPFPAEIPLPDLDQMACTHHGIKIRAEFIRGDVSRRRRDMRDAGR